MTGSISVALQAGEQGAHAAGDIEAHAAGGDHAALIGVEGGDPADRKAVSPVGIGHGIGCLDDPRQGSDVGDLFEHLVIHGANQLRAGVDDARNPHGAALIIAPLEFRYPGQLRRVHGRVL